MVGKAMDPVVKNNIVAHHCQSKKIKITKIKKKIIKNQNKKIDKTKKILFMGLQNLTFSGGGEGGAAGSHKFLFSTGQIFCQKILYHIVAMIVLKRFRIVMHC